MLGSHVSDDKAPPVGSVGPIGVICCRQRKLDSVGPIVSSAAALVGCLVTLGAILSSVGFHQLGAW